MHPSGRFSRPSSRPASLLGLGLGLSLALAGCASVNTVDSDVSSFGTWPAGRAPGTYAFDRLPSQSAHPDRQQALEAEASGALARAGFRPAPDPAQADVVVQLGARVEVTETTPWADPLWWHGPWAGTWGPGWRPAYGPFYRPALWPRGWYGGPGWGPGPIEQDTRYGRQVAVLVRDRATGQPLYEAHAESSGYTVGSGRLISAMFDAAMSGFPTSDGQPHTVRTMLPPAAAPLPPMPASAPSS